MTNSVLDTRDSGIYKTEFTPQRVYIMEKEKVNTGMNKILVLGNETTSAKRATKERLPATDSLDRLKEEGEFEVEPREVT